MQNAQSMYRPVQHEFELNFSIQPSSSSSSPSTTTLRIHTVSLADPLVAVPHSTYIQSHLPSQTRHNQHHKQQQTANTQKRLYKHACIRVAPLQPNEWPLSRHLLQSNSAAALLCSAHQPLLCFLLLSARPLGRAGLGSLPHKLVW